MAERLEHVLALSLRIDWRAAFQLDNGSIRAEADMNLAISRGFFQKSDVAAVQHVKAAADEYFFRGHANYSLFGTDFFIQ